MEWPPGWKVSPDGKRVAVAVRAKDFLDALDLFEEVGRVAEELEHHPDLHLESYDRVRIETYSHDVGGLTERDQRLARRIADVLARRRLGPG